MKKTVYYVEPKCSTRFTEKLNIIVILLIWLVAAGAKSGHGITSTHYILLL